MHERDMSDFILKNGEKLRYEDTGAGEETVVMLHGWTSTRKVFASALPAISRAARCITFDFRGHGDSRRANRDTVTLDTLAGDLDELIRGLGLHDITLLGWSMGAAVALSYASAYGCGSLRQLILCDMTPRLLNGGDWTLGLDREKLTRADTLEEIEADLFPLFRRFSAETIPKLAGIPDVLLWLPLKRRLAACDEGVLASLAFSMKETDLRPCVEEITVPVTYFYAVPGSLFSPALADWYGAHVKTPFRSVAFPHSTHILIREHPRRFAREVIRALDREGGGP